jgi:hypothetical protein
VRPILPNPAATHPKSLSPTRHPPTGRALLAPVSSVASAAGLASSGSVRRAKGIGQGCIRRQSGSSWPGADCLTSRGVVEGLGPRLDSEQCMPSAGCSGSGRVARETFKGLRVALEKSHQPYQALGRAVTPALRTSSAMDAQGPRVAHVVDVPRVQAPDGTQARAPGRQQRHRTPRPWPGLPFRAPPNHLAEGDPTRRRRTPLVPPRDRGRAHVGKVAPPERALAA